ncbi:MAG: SufS family cysteine desulfurase [Acidobacteria bacterium]|nr:SufS family cysteine desulfurase [Acidobacteriota bacterium]
MDVQALRRDFPSLDQQVHDKPLAYLDNAASAQTPLPVIDAIRDHYLRDRSNVHRGVHELSQRATNAYEKARVKVQRFLNAPSYEEIIWTRGTTEGVNLVASSWGRANVRAGDEVLISALEHHSNIVPWQMLCQQSGATLRVIPMNQAGELLQDEYERLLTERTKLVAVNHVSNALGTINPVREMIAKAHAVGAVVLIDGAQAIPHMAVDVRALDADFYAFSGHKIFGPTGIGALYGKKALLEAMPPYQGGGDMIASVTFEKTIYNDLPYKFEAGTPNIADAIGLGAAVDYVQKIGMDAIAAYEAELLSYATEKVAAIDGVRLIGTARHKASVLSFEVVGVHPHDVGTILDREGVAVRAGHHCAQPVMEFYGVAATTRASFAFYNTREEIDQLVGAIGKVKELFG